MLCYYLHPKDGEGTVFTGVYLSTRGGVPGPLSLVQVLSGRGGTLGLWFQVLSRGCPSQVLGQG